MLEKLAQRFLHFSLSLCLFLSLSHFRSLSLTRESYTLNQQQHRQRARSAYTNNHIILFGSRQRAKNTARRQQREERTKNSEFTHGFFSSYLTCESCWLTINHFFYYQYYFTLEFIKCIKLRKERRISNGLLQV